MLWSVYSGEIAKWKIDTKLVYAGNILQAMTSLATHCSPKVSQKDLVNCMKFKILRSLKEIGKADVLDLTNYRKHFSRISKSIFKKITPLLSRNRS